MCRVIEPTAKSVVPMILYYYSKVLLDTKPVDIIAKLKFSDKSKKKIKKESPNCKFSDYRQKIYRQKRITASDYRQKLLSLKVKKVPGKVRRTFVWI